MQRFGFFLAPAACFSGSNRYICHALTTTAERIGDIHGIYAVPYGAQRRKACGAVVGLSTPKGNGFLCFTTTMKERQNDYVERFDRLAACFEPGNEIKGRPAKEFIRNAIALRGLQRYFCDTLNGFEGEDYKGNEGDDVFDLLEEALGHIEAAIPHGFFSMLMDWEPDEKEMEAAGYSLASTRRNLQDSDRYLCEKLAKLEESK